MFDNVSEKIVDFGNFEASQLLDALALGGTMLLIGMLTIFAVLSLLWLLLVLFKIAFQGMDKKKESEKAEVSVVVPQPLAPKTNDSDEIIAAIAAAIAMAESESSGIKFKVVSFRRK